MTITIPVLQSKTLRHIDVKSSAQGQDGGGRVRVPTLNPTSQLLRLDLKPTVNVCCLVRLFIFVKFIFSFQLYQTINSKSTITDTIPTH